MGRLENGLSMRFFLELEMGPFPIELQIENRAVSLQPCGARDGDLCPTYGGSTKKEAILKDNLLNNGARDGDLCPTYGGSTKKRLS